jgi:arylsulfatase A-like enzyme
MYPLDQIQLPPYRDDDLNDIPRSGVKMARAPGSKAPDVPSDHERMLKSGRWKEAVQAYQAAISYVDGQIGRVLDALDQSVYRDNTIVVFFGDHGWSLGEKHHWRKFALWEEATRAPLIWVAPGVELCGLPVPAHLEGVSIRKLLADPDAGWDRPALMTHGYRNHAVRSAQWRYIRYENGDEELYDETKDPFEWTNLANDRSYDGVKQELASVFPKVNTRK